MSDAALTARRMWTLFEPVHIVELLRAGRPEAFEQAGLRGFWRGYFAGRAAPLGPVGSGAGHAAFFSFAPGHDDQGAARGLGADLAAQALVVREAGAVAALRELLHLAGDDQVPAPVACRRRPAGRRRVRRLDIAGRMLGAANAALPVPAEPLARLWHAATVLREHRGDGHVAALVAADVDAPEALVLRTAVVPGTLREQFQPARGWTDAEWTAAAVG